LYTYLTNRFFFSAWFLYFSLSCTVTFAAEVVPDYPREKRWADEVVPNLIVGESVYLRQKNGHAFFSILAEVENAPTAIIVVHGMGIHPNWGMVSDLRLGLFDNGYTTLSIQMPILAADASYKLYPALFADAAERLDVAKQYLIKKGYGKVVIVSHSNGSRMSRMYMKNNPASIAVWVAISLTQEDTFVGVKVPIFDLYGEDDLPHVLSSVYQRKVSFKNKQSQQTMIAGANHFFAGKEALMVEVIKNYLAELKF